MFFLTFLRFKYLFRWHVYNITWLNHFIFNSVVLYIYYFALCNIYYFELCTMNLNMNTLNVLHFFVVLFVLDTWEYTYMLCIVYSFCSINVGIVLIAGRDLELFTLYSVLCTDYLCTDYLCTLYWLPLYLFICTSCTCYTLVNVCNCIAQFKASFCSMKVRAVVINGSILTF